MRIPASWWKGLTVTALGMGLAVGMAVPQKPGTGQVPNGTAAPDPFGDIPGSKTRADDPQYRNVEQKQAKLRNEERQHRLVADTDKLLELATQLHKDVAKTDKNILSVDVVKRADEIERLAHNVKERMKD